MDETRVATGWHFSNERRLAPACLPAFLTSCPRLENNRFKLRSIRPCYLLPSRM